MAPMTVLAASADRQALVPMAAGLRGNLASAQAQVGAHHVGQLRDW